MIRQSIFPALVAAAGYFQAGPARADKAADAALAQSLYEEARRLMDSGTFVSACPKLEESQRLDPALGTQFYLAECYEKAGRTASAWALFLEVASQARSQQRAANEKRARVRAAALESKLSKFSIMVPEGSRSSALKIRRGDTELNPATWGTPVAIDPGTHTITVSAPGKKTLELTVEVPLDGGVKEVEIPTLEDDKVDSQPALVRGAASTRPTVMAKLGDGTEAKVANGKGIPPMRLASYAGLGIGLVGLAAGTYFSIQSASKRSDADAVFGSCGGRCPSSDPRAQEGQGLYDDAASAKTGATISFIAGGIGLASGATLLFLSRKPARASQTAVTMEPWVGVGSAGWKGVF